MSEIIAKSESLVASLYEAVEVLERGDIIRGIPMFGKVKRNGLVLIKETEYLLERVNAVESHYKGIEMEKIAQINKLYHSEKSAKRDKELKEKELKSREEDLHQAQFHYSAVQRQEARAIGRKHAAQNIEKNSKERGDNLKIATLATLGLVAPVTVPAMIMCNFQAKQARQEGEKAEKDINFARERIRKCEREITQFKKKVEQLDSEIETLSKQIKLLESERDRVHAQRGELCETIKYLREVLNFWKEFSLITDEGVKRTSILQALLKKIGIHNSYTSKLSTYLQSCVSTCERIEQKLDEAGSHLFSIDFVCKFCYGSFHNLPHLKNGEFCCINCCELRV